MKIAVIEVQDACGINGTRTIELPEQGLVLVEGPNGSGKSSLFCDVPAAAAWGCTMRSATTKSDAKETIPPWRKEGHDGRVKLVTRDHGGLEIERSRVRGKVQLSFTGGQQYDNPTKAQPALTRLIGTFESWRRTSVFSGQDAIRLSIACMTAGQLMKLVEQLLGHNFDGALEACRKDLRTLQQEHNRQGVVVSDASATLRAAKRNAQELLEACPEVEPLVGPSCGQLQKLLDRAKKQEGVVLESEQAARDKVTTQQERLSSLRRRAQQLASGVCPTCGQTVESLHQHVADDIERHEATLDSLRAAHRQEQAERLEVLHEVQDILARMQFRHAAEERHRQQQNQRDNMMVLQQKAQQTVAEAQEAFDQLWASYEGVQREVATMTAVEQVLGLKGPRVAICQRALRVVLATANLWLGRISNMKISLPPNGALDLEGAGGGYGYGAASTGQRRRIDLSLWLGYCELDPQHRGGTLVLDEALDGLDHEGRAGVVEAVERLAERQCCVLITHDPDLAKALAGRSAVMINTETM